MVSHCWRASPRHVVRAGHFAWQFPLLAQGGEWIWSYFDFQPLDLVRVVWWCYWNWASKESGYPKYAPSDFEVSFSSQVKHFEVLRVVVGEQ